MIAILNLHLSIIKSVSSMLFFYYVVGVIIGIFSVKLLYSLITYKF